MKPEQTGAGRTVQDLFFITPQMLTAKLRAAMGQPAERIDKGLGDWKTLAHSPHFAEEISVHVCGFLSVALAGILAGAWHTYAELKDAANETLADPSLTSTVSLTEHEFSYEWTPGIHVLVDGVKLAHLEFKIELSCTVQGVLLSLRGGCIASIRSGRAECRLQVSCGDNTVFTRSIAALDLPGLFKLSEPLRIAGPGSTRIAAIR